MTNDGRELAVVLPPREVFASGLNLQEIKDQIAQRGILIPAGEGRELVRILPRPAFLRWEHELDIANIDMAKTKKSSPVVIGVHMIGIGDPPGEVRIIKLPVQTQIDGGVYSQAEERIIREMEADGFSRREIDQLTAQHKTQHVLGLVDGLTFLHLTRALGYGHFETSAIPDEYEEYGENGRLQSGWKQEDYWPLVVFSNWKARIEVLFASDNTTAITKESIISDPLTQDALNVADPVASNLIRQIMKKN